ncbi:hypothetical protein RFI_30521 [Reticulomyxa filosa]|uniref:Uncharacterized protein n=1 Tax=Reticulomyxa filosa TaxID=46433 RepID=X6M0G6_RETFI|nr:hypothetical protein RFI_30521 [Reticulomyxa filosa]|eukprot:ETO06872.1 hypothetical protein RFI_30521 [Reticulomyxa filosa]
MTRRRKSSATLTKPRDNTSQPYPTPATKKGFPAKYLKGVTNNPLIEFFTKLNVDNETQWLQLIEEMNRRYIVSNKNRNNSQLLSVQYQNRQNAVSLKESLVQSAHATIFIRSSFTSYHWIHSRDNHNHQPIVKEKPKYTTQQPDQVEEMKRLLGNNCAIVALSEMLKMQSTSEKQDNDITHKCCYMLWHLLSVDDNMEMLLSLELSQQMEKSIAFESFFYIQCIIVLLLRNYRKDKTLCELMLSMLKYNEQLNGMVLKSKGAVRVHTDGAILFSANNAAEDKKEADNQSNLGVSPL